MSISTPKRVKVDHNKSNNADQNDENESPPGHQALNGSSGYYGEAGWGQVYANGGGSGLEMASPSTSCGSPEFSSSRGVQHVAGAHFSNPEFSGGKNENRRGRPRSESLTTLMFEGSTSPSSIKCKFCSRVFPREKSLAAHLRTHTGERPYTCDYPGCTRAFTQSGQLKTHQRLHTGERPFICSVPNCEMRFTHANRHCPVHVNSQLKRDDNFVVNMTPEQDAEVLRWLEKYRSEREDRSTPTRKTPQRGNNTGSNSKSGPSSVQWSKENHKPGGLEENYLENNENGGSVKRQNDENECPVTPNNQYKSRKGLMVELDMNAGLAFSPVAPLKMKPQPKIIQWHEPLSQEEDSDEEEEERRVQVRNSPSKKNCSFYPKKKWLREACLDDLAKPLDLPKAASPKKFSSPQKQQIKSMNLMRPTVLMLASKDKAVSLSEVQPPETSPRPEESNRKWLGAMALMQLAAESDSSMKVLNFHANSLEENLMPLTGGVVEDSSDLMAQLPSSEYTDL